MPTGLQRIHERGDIHFVTASCFRRQPLLGTPELRDIFQIILFETAQKYLTGVEAYVVMPEHIHLLLAPPDNKALFAVVQVIKQRYTRTLKKAAPVLYERIQQKTAHPPPMPVWETRSYNSNVRTKKAFDNAYAYIHDNPVKRGLVARSADWKWSS